MGWVAAHVIRNKVLVAVDVENVKVVTKELGHPALDTSIPMYFTTTKGFENLFDGKLIHKK